MTKGDRALNDIASHPEIQMVTFFLNGEEYGLDVMKVREIICLPEITKTVNSPHYVAGMIDLRGNIVPVISLRKRLCLPDAPNEDDSLVAVMDFSGSLVGYIVDDISEVIRVKRDDIKPPVVNSDQSWISGILHLGEKLVIVMNLEQLG